MTTINKIMHFEEEMACKSEIKYKNFKLEWIIDDFETVCNEMKSIESPRFPSTKTEHGQYFIQLFPAELNAENEEDFEVYLECTDEVDRYIRARIIFSNISGTVKELEMPFQNTAIDAFWSFTGSEIYKKALSNNNSIPKEMKIICELQVFKTVKNVFQPPPVVPATFKTVLDQLGNIYLNEDFSDVNFTVEETKFAAHKAILAFRSPVFATLFKTFKTENLFPLKIDITDINVTTFEKMLKFIYTEKIDNLDEIAFEMFHAAEKYQLEKLKYMCVDCLCKNLNLSTVVKSLELADSFSISNLKEKSLKFLVSNLQEIKGTAEFVKLIKERPHLSIEIIEERNFFPLRKEKDLTEDTIFKFREN